MQKAKIDFKNKEEQFCTTLNKRGTTSIPCCLVYDVYACVCGLEGRGICDVLCQSGGYMSMFNGMHVSILIYPICFISETTGNFHGDTNKVYSILFYYIQCQEVDLKSELN